MSKVAAPPSTHSPAEHWERQLQFRLQRMGLGVAVVLLVSVLGYALGGRGVTAMVLGLALLAVLSLPLVRRGWGVPATADALLWILTIMVFAISLVGHGLRDISLLALPALLMISVMLRRFRTLWWLLAVQVLGVLGLWGAPALGVWTPSLEVAGAMQAFNAISILALTAWATHQVVQDQAGALDALFSENQRVTQALQHIEHATRHDTLTGLPNRRAALSALDAACWPSHAALPSKVLLLLNLDNFKSVNESLGPEVGDDYLVELAGRLRRHKLASEEVYRVGSDEFLVLACDAGASDEQRLQRAQSWVDLMGEPVDLAGLSIGITASAGLARYPLDAQTPKDLMLKADLALQRAKDGGRNLLRPYDTSMGGGSTDQLQMLADLRLALARNEFLLHYQPKFRLADGRCCGAEALLRWRHPNGHWVSPGTFIPLAEKSGLINELGSWVLDEACRQMAQWRDAGCAPLPVAVNVSMVQFRKGDLFDVVYRCLQAHGLPGSALEIELTESLLSDGKSAVEQTLSGLRQLGVALSIDDFGTGYSNLGYLKRFEIHTLKIDQSFVRRLTQGGSEEAIVHAIVHMATRLGLSTVAEGVEDAAVAQHLQALGCEMGQGYLWSPAVAPAEFKLKYLQQQQVLSLQPA